MSLTSGAVSRVLYELGVIDRFALLGLNSDNGVLIIAVGLYLLRVNGQRSDGKYAYCQNDRENYRNAFFSIIMTSLQNCIISCLALYIICQVFTIGLEQAV